MRDARGMTLIEVMVAVLVLAVGILALVTTFNAARGLTLTAERRNVLTHRAQRAIERMETYSYSKLAMSEAPKHASGTPDEYVDYNNPVTCKEAAANDGCLAWNATKTAEEAPIVVESTGVISPIAEKWSAGNVSGETYMFVTWANDPVCKAELCPAENDYKRVTAIVTAAVPGATHALTPVRVSSLIANPNSAPKEETPRNPLKTLTCGNGEKCTSGIGSGNAQSWFLHDYSALASSPTEPTASNPTHDTVAPEKSQSCTSSDHSGCPQPDLMEPEAPTATELFDYSTDQDSLGATLTSPPGVTTWTCPGVSSGGLCYGGRALQRSATECGGEPSENEAEANFRNEMWVTPPLAGAMTLTGSGGIALYSQAIAGASQDATLCVALYRIPNDIEDLWATPESTPEQIAWTSYTPANGGTWPSTLEQVSFAFEPSSSRTLKEPNGTIVGASGSATIKLEAGQRLGLRVWPAPTSTTDITLVYGTGGRTETIEGAQTEVARYAAQLQLNTE